MHFKGRISISRNMSVGDEQPIRIELLDEKSRVQFLTLKMTLADLALALTGQREINCEGEIQTKFVGSIGKIRENKTIEVEFAQGSYKTRGDIVAAACKPYEVDGWIARLEDGMNHHNFVRSVRATRPSDSEGAPPVPCDSVVHRIGFTRLVRDESEAGQKETE